MFVVAVAELARDLETEAAALGTLLGLPLLEARTRLLGVLPRVVFHSASEADAVRLATALHERGNGVVACDARVALAGRTLVRVHRFTLGDEALWANGPSGTGERLAYADLGAIVVLSARTDVARTTKEQEVQYMAHRSTLAPVRVEVEHTSHEHVVEHVAYLFPRPLPGAPPPPPWILGEREAQYLGLGAAMRPTRHDNFLATLAQLRARAPAALHDDRYYAHPQATAHLVSLLGHETAVGPLHDVNTGLTAHLLAQWLMFGRGGQQPRG